MTDRELRKLSRRKLLKYVGQQEQQNERLVARANQLEEQNEKLTAKINQLEERLKSRKIEIDNAGSLAEAALILNGVLENTDKAAAQYLENIKRCREQQESIYNKTIAEAEQKANVILANAEVVKQQKMQEADEYWDTLSNRLEVFYEEHIALRELLTFQTRKKLSEDK